LIFWNKFSIIPNKIEIEYRIQESGDRMEKRESGNQKIRMQDNRIADYQEALLFMIRSTALRAYPELAEGTGLLFTIDYFSVASVLSVAIRPFDYAQGKLFGNKHV
jgi:hypothetical protein